MSVGGCVAGTDDPAKAVPNTAVLGLRTGSTTEPWRQRLAILGPNRAIALTLRHERRAHSLQPTALVNEAFLRLVPAKDIKWKNRGHFLALTARIMRHYLVDHARARFKGELVSWDDFPADFLREHSKIDLIVAVDQVLDELEEKSPQQRKIVELKFFVGLTDQEAADALELPIRTFQREWHVARAWLFNRLNAKPRT